MLVTILSVGVVSIAYHGISKKRMARWAAERQTREASKLQDLAESFGGIKELLANGKADYYRSRFAHNVAQLSIINRKFLTILGLPRLFLELLSVMGLGVLVIAMIGLGRDADQILASLALFAGGAFRLMPAINRITIAVQSLRMGWMTVEALQNEARSDQSGEVLNEFKIPVEFQNLIEFEKVSFSYPNSEISVLESIDLKVKKGAQIGVTGTTGAGKSTFVDVLIGLLRPTSGRVLIDGVDITGNLSSWRNLIGYVPQSIYLRDASVRENIAFGVQEKDIDDSRIRTALELAHLSEFVKSLPEGLNEMVGERGVRLSGGQRQRIGIARALYHDPPILVLDEATSALDDATERDIMQSLKMIEPKKTIFFVTHGHSALEECDELVKLKNGGVSN
jgi:ABC-type multidrug transport system fused ATPase/permease subunit